MSLSARLPDACEPIGLVASERPRRAFDFRDLGTGTAGLERVVRSANRPETSNSVRQAPPAAPVGNLCNPLIVRTGELYG